MPTVMKRFRRGNTFGYQKHTMYKPSEFKTRRYDRSHLKPNPYTMRETKLKREELPYDTYWTGYERRPGRADLRSVVLERDSCTCQLCERQFSVYELEIDHIRPVRKFKRPIDANDPDNLWTLCIECHTWKTEADRQRESRMR